MPAMIIPVPYHLVVRTTDRQTLSGTLRLRNEKLVDVKVTISELIPCSVTRFDIHREVIFWRVFNNFRQISS